MRTFYLIITVIVFLLTSTHGAFAQTATPEPTTQPTSKPLDDTLQIIKDKIENKVDEINKSSKKVIYGVLNKIENNVIELQESSGKVFKVNIDDTVTDFYTATTRKFSPVDVGDLDKGDTLIVFGPIIEDQISANKVIQQSDYITVQGEVTNVDETTFTLDLVTYDKEEISLDLEDAVSQLIMNTKTLDFAKATISKYKIGDKVHAVFIKPAKEGDKAIAVRTLLIPQEYFATTASPSPTEKPKE
ncbi:hypothetical protein E6Q11_05370 [Candidatus Dojkabacteria bacterium]|uniref:DUF5666 domain-containing protein n=1 Tax=Candidatus Dojkabacteria bacterium TaxID=2099670 RepID=A0A5C7J3J6_9BACT|nr:MAG: hypothetical protein E6Q11_05370 [Candidatus Dojkabacteria bacterium]